MRLTRPQHWPALEQLWSLATVALVALRVQLTPIAPNDFWWHLATGRLIANTGHIPRLDQFSYTRTAMPYYNQPWLAQLFMYRVYQIGGAALLELVQAVIIGATFALLFRLCHNAGLSARMAALVTLCGALVAMDNWQIRPQTYALPLFISSLYILERWRCAGRAALWCLPLLMVIWVNLHGTFTLLLVLCAAYLVGPLIDRLLQHPRAPWIWAALLRLAAWTAVTLAATLLNPRSWAIWLYIANLLRNQSVTQLVTEWASPLRNPWEPMTIVFWLLLALFVVFIARCRRKLESTHMLLAAGFTLLALQSVRNILWWGSIAALICAYLLARERPATNRRHLELPLLNRMIATLLAALLLATLPWWKAGLGLPPELGNLLSVQTPRTATTQLQRLPILPQHLFHEMGFGSYLIWAAPNQRVFVDPRIELYPYEQWRDYILLGQGRNVDELAQRYHFDGWLINPAAQRDLLTALDHDPRWQRLFTTPDAVYFGPATAHTPLP
ncbi:MAG: hypothetical protein H0X37_05345 [Herpetosiphonaceae bacterium]|nr:hypothetical protein [Herpetosiphonaceae bacterium]